MTHRYRSSLTWAGSTAGGYRGYSRAHRVATPPAAAALAVSADPSFAGDPLLHNPEQLLLAAASSCQLLSFLAVAAVARVEVLAYEDEAEAEMPVTAGPMRITRITLRPRVVVGSEVDAATVVEMLHRAHETCYVANTINAEMALEPTVVHAPGGGASAARMSPVSGRTERGCEEAGRS